MHAFQVFCRVGPRLVVLAIAAVLAVAEARPGRAAELRIGMKAAVDSADPHQAYTPNRNVRLHVYESLLFQDDRLIAHAGLAESWRVVDPLTWEFTLRPGVRFHDGSPLTPQDVAYSIMRAKAATGVRTYGASVRNVVSVEPTGERTFLIHEREPTPLQPDTLTAIAIVSARASAGATAADWNGGPAAVGTGPYKWVRWIPSQEVVLERNPDYWGEKEPWDRVTFRFISNDSARVAALLAGDIDVADTIPAELFGRLRSDEKVKLVSADSTFNDYLYLDSLSPVIANATGADGKVLPQNPLRDLRVRMAIDHAINRTALAERAMQGGATPAGQIAPEGFRGFIPDLAPTRYDPALARRLLAEAGYPQGFSLVLHCTSDRFAGDARTCQAVGQMLNAVGIRPVIEALPSSIYFRRWATITPAGSSEFSAAISIFGASSGLTGEGLTTIVRTADPERGLGTSNRRFVSDPVLDGLLSQMDQAFDATERDSAMQAAVRRAMDQRLVLPLFFLKATWGLRRDLVIAAWGNQDTMVTSIRPIPSPR